MNHAIRTRAFLAFAMLVMFSACSEGSDDGNGTGSQNQGGAQTGTGNGATNGDTVNPDVVPVSCAGVTPDVTVIMQNLAFAPASVDIENGDYVRWFNNDTVSHTVTSSTPENGSAGAVFDSGVLGIGQSVCFQFNTVANFNYFCRLHPEMMRNGVVAVRQSGNDDDEDDDGDEDSNDDDSNDDNDDDDGPG